MMVVGKIVNKKTDNHNVYLITIKIDNSLSNPVVSSFVYIYDDLGNRKPYSHLSSTDGLLLFAIKKYDEGRISKYICEKNVNDQITIDCYSCKDEYVMNKYKHIGMIAGGTGITPFLQILKHALENPDNKTKFTLFNCNKTPNDVFCLELLERYLKFKNFTLFNIFTDNSANDDYMHLNLEMFLKFKNNDEYDFIYVCGPPSMLNDVCGPKSKIKKIGGFLKKAGYSENNVYKF